MGSSKHVFNHAECKCSRLARVTRYLAEYASWMLGCGATCTRITKNMERMAATVNLSVDLIIFPAHVMVTASESGRDDGEAYCHSHAIAHVPVSYDLITRLSKLSWDVAEGRLSLEESQWAFRRLIRARPYNRWGVMVLVALANMSFCRIFGGDPGAMAAVALATAAGYSLKLLLVSQKLDLKLTVIFCSLLSALIAGGACKLGLTSTPEVALGTSVLYLIPGIPYINSVHDMIAGHFICSYSRMMSALLLTACIAIGLTVGFVCMDFKVF